MRLSRWAIRAAAASSSIRADYTPVLEVHGTVSSMSRRPDRYDGTTVGIGPRARRRYRGEQDLSPAVVVLGHELLNVPIRSSLQVWLPA